MEVHYQYLIGKLQEALAADSRVSSLDVKIRFTAGKVHLTGEVGTEERKAALTEVVRSVLPGTPVCNEVTVLGLVGSPQLERIHG